MRQDRQLSPQYGQAVPLELHNSLCMRPLTCVARQNRGCAVVIATQQSARPRSCVHRRASTPERRTTLTCAHLVPCATCAPCLPQHKGAGYHIRYAWASPKCCTELCGIHARPRAPDTGSCAAAPRDTKAYPQQLNTAHTMVRRFGVFHSIHMVAPYNLIHLLLGPASWPRTPYLPYFNNNVLSL